MHYVMPGQISIKYTIMIYDIAQNIKENYGNIGGC